MADSTPDMTDSITPTEEDLIDEMQRVVEENDLDSITKKQFDAHSDLYTSQDIDRAFGNWRQGVKAAGYEPKSRGPSGITREEFLDEIKLVAADLGKDTVTTSDMAAHDDVGTPQRAYKWFDSFTDAVEAAGLTVNIKNHTHRRTPKETLLQDLRDAAEKLGKKTLTVREINEHTPWSDALYNDRFGSKDKALEEAGLEPNK